MSPAPTLSPQALPWMISPSGAGLRLSYDEEQGRATIDVVVSYGPLEARSGVGRSTVELQFEGCCGLRLAPILDEAAPLAARSLDRSKLAEFDPGEDARVRLAGMLARWRESGCCPDPHVYELLGSDWATQFDAPGLHHYLVLGSAVIVDVLAQSLAWTS